MPPVQTPAPMLAPESLVATSRAAEQWRSSWLNRQHDEAGPAVDVSRGQAAVPQPLMAMQHSIARMRAVVLPKKAQQKQSMSFGFWVTIVMMICLIGGLGIYIISTYITGTPLQNQINTISSGPDPMISVNGTNTTTVKAGQSLSVHGAYFGAGNTIIFLLNASQLTVSTRASSQGTFTATIPIPATTLAGSYVLQAQDNQIGKHAFLDLQILPQSNVSTTTVAEVTTVQGTVLTSLKFTATLGQSNPPGQRIVLKNRTNNILQWTSTTVTNDGANWLLITTDMTQGTLNMDATANIGIDVVTASLKNGPYTGSVIFTIAGQGQVILPVSLQIGTSTPELVINPNPVTAGIQAGGTCQATLTLIDLSNTPVQWEAKVDDTFSQHHITINGRADVLGSLDPGGPTGSTQVLKLACTGANLNDTYHITVYYDNMAQHIPVNISGSN